jgi:transcription antitermination factor NusG
MQSNIDIAEIGKTYQLPCDLIWRSLILTALHTIPSEFPSNFVSEMPVEKSWFAIQTRPKFEKKVAFELQEKGVESFLPLHSVKHQWSDRRQNVSLPLFSGYTFVRIAPAQGPRIAVLRTNGVINFVGARGIGTPIPDGEIEAVQMLLAGRVSFTLHPYLKVGQSVRIRGGALDGIKGILTKVNGDQSLVISVGLIQRSVAMRVTGYDIEPA